MTLFEKLIAAGLPVSDATEAGMVSVQPGTVLTPIQQQSLSDIVMEHLDPNGYALMVRVRNRSSASKITAKAIPSWATWTQQDWATWRDANISSTQITAVANLADAKVMLGKMATVLDSLAKMEIALRDQVWPDLPE